MVERAKVHVKGIRRILSRFIKNRGIIMMHATATKK
jgi:hypothetical protein